MLGLAHFTDCPVRWFARHLLPLLFQPAMQPYMVLAERMGKLHAQMSTSKVVKLGLRTYGGQAANIEASPARQVIFESL